MSLGTWGFKSPLAHNGQSLATVRLISTEPPLRRDPERGFFVVPRFDALASVVSVPVVSVVVPAFLSGRVFDGRAGYGQAGKKEAAAGVRGR